MVKPQGRDGEPVAASRHSPGSWQNAGEQVIDGPRPEDGTDLSSYAAGASPDIARNDRSIVVVAGHSDHACARAD